MEVVHINMPCLNLGTCSVICDWMCLNLGISSILKQNNVLPKFRQRARCFYLTFCTLPNILHKRSKIGQKRMGQYTKNDVLILHHCSVEYPVIHSNAML